MLANTSPSGCKKPQLTAFSHPLPPDSFLIFYPFDSFTYSAADCTVLTAHGCVATGWNRAIPPVWRRRRQPFKPTRGMPRKLAGFQPHCAYALFRPASKACMRKPARGMPRKLAGFHPHNRTLYPVQLRFLG